MSDALSFAIRYSDGGEGWVMAQVEQAPGAISHGDARARRGLALAKLADSDAFPDRLYGDFVEIFYDLIAGAGARPSTEVLEGRSGR